MFFELLCHPVLVVCRLHCLGLLWPWMGLPSWGKAIPLGDLFWLHLGLVIWGHQVEKLMVETLYCILLLLGVWWLLPWSLPFLRLCLLFGVLPSCFFHFVVAGTTVFLSMVPRIQWGSWSLCHMWVGKEFHWLLSGVNNDKPKVYWGVPLSIDP